VRAGPSPKGATRVEAVPESLDFVPHADMMITLAETTIDSIEREPRRRRAFTRGGFHAFWNAITGPGKR
jgi:hypothetical protein